MGLEAIKTGITTSGFVPVRLPVNQGCSTYSLWTEDGAYWIYSHNSAGDTPIKVTSDGSASLSVSISNIVPPDSAGAIICYAKGSSSTNLVGLITGI